MHYGGDFPDFLSTDESPQGVLLRHIAEVEKLCNLAYAAPKARHLTAEEFIACEEEARLQLPIKLAEACFVSRSLPRRLAEALCADDIFEIHLTDYLTDYLTGDDDKETDHVLITRPHDLVLKHALSPNEADFLNAIEKHGFALSLENFVATIEDAQTLMQILAHFFTIGCFAVKDNAA